MDDLAMQSEGSRSAERACLTVMGRAWRRAALARVKRSK